MMAQLQIGVIGGGSFGTVLAQLASANRHQVNWWLRSEAQRRAIASDGINPKCPAHGKIAPTIALSASLEQVCQQSQLLIIALPASAFADFLPLLRPHLRPEHSLVSAAKGITEPPLQTTGQALARCSAELGLSYGVVSGPNIAYEIAHKHLTGSVIASADAELRQQVRAALGASYFHVFENEDCYGVELGGILKNIYAIAAGAVDELQFGVNSKSLLMVRAMSEILRLSTHLGARRDTFFGLAGMGDLIATSISSNSRNYQLGQRLAQGHKLAEAQSLLPGVAEGVRTLEMVCGYARDHNIDMPLAMGLAEVLFAGSGLRRTFWRLLKNTPTLDVENLDSAS